MEREQIIKALECCKTPLSSDCENCSYTGKRLEDGVYEGCVNCLVGDALALITSQEQRIKELAEENERLRAIPEQMKERLQAYFGTYVLGYKIPLSEALKAVNQIAKEILEGL